tara:strand:+ start:907 stop:2241 length:1335 start_codon:yes stop_codon:yes gene_type:complete
MSLEILKTNIAKEKRLVQELEVFVDKLRRVNNPREKISLQNAIKSYENQIKILNNSLPLVLNEISLIGELPSESSNKVKKRKENLVNISYNLDGNEEFVTISRKDKSKFLSQLSISDSSLRDLKKKKVIRKEDKENVYKSPSSYVKLSNKFFFSIAKSWIDQRYFRKLKTDLKKGGFIFLLNSYVSVMLFTTFLSFFVGLFIALFFFFFNISSVTPFISIVDFSSANLLLRLAYVIWVIPVFPLIVYLIFLFYPSTEASTVEQQIDYELPFATIQMSAIAGADIEPSNIFRIIAMSKEYKFISRESKKLMNQINLYGYDLVTALKNVARSSPSKLWADVLNGISTTIRSGGDLGKYLSKRAETLLFDYRLKREKATKAAETFMDIYISVVIAAPMLMMLLLILMNVSGIGFNMSNLGITVLVVSIVALINILFLVFLQMNQKKF